MAAPTPQELAIARQFASILRQSQQQARASQAAHRSVELAEGGSVTYYDADGNPRLVVGTQDDGTFGVVPVNSTPPPRPTSPDVLPIQGGLNVVYDGTFETANTPADFSHFEVHASPDPNFVPDDTNQVSSFTSPNGGTYFYPALPDDGEIFFCIQAVNTEGLESDPSVFVGGVALPVTAEPPPPSDGNPPASSPPASIQGSVGILFITWPKIENADPVTYDVYLSDTTPVVIDPSNLLVSTVSNSYSARKLPDGTALAYTDENGDPVPYYAVVVARDLDGAADPGAEGTGSMHQVTGPDVSAAYVYAGKVLAGQIQSGDLNADIAVINGSLTVGNITIRPPDPSQDDPGGITIPLSNGGVIDLPADGSNANIQASLTALSILVQDNLRMQGQNNDIEGSLQIASVPQAPKTPAAVSLNITPPPWTFVVPIPENSAAGFPTYSGAGSIFYLILKGPTTDFPASDWCLYSLDASDGSISPEFSLQVIGDTGPLAMNGINGLTRNPTTGEFWISYYDDQFDDSTTQARVKRFLADGTYHNDHALGADWTRGKTNGEAPALGWDPDGNLLVCGKRGSPAGYNLYVYSYSYDDTAITFVPGSNYNLFDNWDDDTQGQVASVDQGTFDFDQAATIVIGTTKRMYTANIISGSVTFAQELPTPGSQLLGFAWNSTDEHFYMFFLGSAGYKIGRIAGRQDTFATRAVKWTQYADGTRVGNHGAHETKASPVVNISHTNRTYLRIETGPPADNGGPDDPNKTRVYIDNHLQTPERAEGQTVSYVEYPTTAGADSPSTEGFDGVPGLSVGQIKSQTTDTSGSLWWFKGDGTFRLAGVTDDTGWVTLPAVAGSGGFGIKYRKRGKVVQVIIDMNGLALGNGTTTTISGSGEALPVGVRPDTAVAAYRVGAYMATFAGIVSIPPSGIIQATNATGATRGSCAAIATYLVD